MKHGFHLKLRELNCTIASLLQSKETMEFRMLWATAWANRKRVWMLNAPWWLLILEVDGLLYLCEHITSRPVVFLLITTSLILSHSVTLFPLQLWPEWNWLSAINVVCSLATHLTLFVCFSVKKFPEKLKKKATQGERAYFIFNSRILVSANSLDASSEKFLYFLETHIHSL